YVAEALVEAILLRKDAVGKRFLLLRADIARPVLREQLIKFGAKVSEVPVYHTKKGTPSQESYAELRAGVDIITFTSSSTVRNFCELLGEEAKAISQKADVVCIGPVTSSTAHELGITVAFMAHQHDIYGLMKLLESYYWRQTQ